MNCTCSSDGPCMLHAIRPAPALSPEGAPSQADRGGEMSEPERIECAAIVGQDDGVIYQLPRPARHSHVIAFMRAQGYTGIASRGQGFITNTGRFVGRAEAKVIALAAGQVKGGKTISVTLTSEDLW